MQTEFFPTTGNELPKGQAVTGYADGYIEVNGFLIDEATGEIFGLMTPKEEFHVTDQGSAEWVLGKMQENDAQMLAAQAQLEAIQRNMQKVLDGLQRRKWYLDWRFMEELRNFAQIQLQNTKKRSVVTPFGTLAFRTTQRKVGVLPGHENEAIDYALSQFPEAVKTKRSLLISEVPKNADLPQGVFSVTPAGESFKVDTGVKKPPAPTTEEE